LWHATQHTRIAREASRLAPHAADLALAVAFSLLNLLLAEDFNLGLPFVCKVLVVISPTSFETMDCFVGDFTSISAH
jgi:hypothetical protein